MTVAREMILCEATESYKVAESALQSYLEEAERYQSGEAEITPARWERFHQRLTVAQLEAHSAYKRMLRLQQGCVETGALVDVAA